MEWLWREPHHGIRDHADTVAAADGDPDRANGMKTWSGTGAACTSVG